MLPRLTLLLPLPLPLLPLPRMLSLPLSPPSRVPRRLTLPLPLRRLQAGSGNVEFLAIAFSNASEDSLRNATADPPRAASQSTPRAAVIFNYPSFSFYVNFIFHYSARLVSSAGCFGDLGSASAQAVFSPRFAAA